MKVNFPKSKWFIAFAITLVVAIAATVAAIVIGVIANRPPEYTEGDEMGVYYYDVEDGEVLLTLSTGNNFTIAGPSMNKTGTYTVEGNTLYLDFFKDGDGTTTATLNGTLLELIYGEAKMNFLKKINYTVSFNVNGGNAVDSVKVVNGKAVAEPAAPTKDGNVFLGWYADEALTTPFAFATTVIKADTTVYAKWAAKTLGVAEYTVDFDLGYDATAPESIRTVSGKAYGVTEPKREGYTFGGWWISMYEDAAKLSYAYTADTVFTADTTLYAVWYDNAATKLNAPAVSVSGNLISWGQVSGASSYILTVTAPDGTVLIDGESMAATVKTYDFSALAAGEYTVSVVAVASSEEKNSDAAVRYYANKTLDRVTDFQVVNGILVFGDVKNAEKYIITVDCGDDNHVHTEFDNGNRTTFYIANCPMQKGGIKITVTAKANGYAPSTSKTYAYDLTLDKVAKVEYNAAKDVFVWDAVSGAAEYLVTVTVGDSTYVINNGSATEFSAAGFTGEFTVSVVPATTGFNSPDGAEATCRKTAPAMPAGITVNGMVISWNAAAGAVKYEVKVGNNTPIVVADGTSIDLAGAGLELTQGQIYEVQVRAISEANDASVYSDALKFGYFAMVDKLNYNKNTVSWAPVLGVNTYKVRVNGGTEITVTDANFARVTLTKEGENVIEVKYVAGQDESDWAAITVVAYAVEYDTRSTFGSFYTEYLAVGDEFLLPGENHFAANKFFKDGYNFIAWATSPMGSAGNGAVMAPGNVFNGSGYTILYGCWTPKNYKITLITDGSPYTISNITDGQEETVIYTKAYTLPVPEIGNPDINFVGWFTQRNGAGTQITDSEGKSLVNYGETRNQTVYPHFNGKELKFILNSDGMSYSVKAGEGIAAVADIVIPVTYKGLPVTHMEDDSFNSYSTIITLKIPDTIQLIGQKAFRSAPNLQSVEVYVADPTKTYETFYTSANGALIRYDMGTTYLECVPKAVGKLNDTSTFVIPDIVTAIKVEAFRYCNVENIVIPNSVVEFPESAFRSCTSLKTVTFEDGRTNPVEFSYDTFFECSSIETFNLPANFDMEIEKFTKFLNQFTRLKAVNIAEGNDNYATVNGMLTNVEGDTIIYCPKGYKDTPNIPRSVTKIAENAFAGCTGITDITIPVWVTSIGKQAFNNASSLTSLTVAGNRSDKLTIGDSAFRGCNSLETITFAANELDAGERAEISLSANAFYGGAAYQLKTVTVGAGAVVSIGNNAFYQQVSLQTVTVEKDAVVKSIGANAFDGCTSLSALKVPASVSSIGQYAFSGCTSLSDLTFDAATDPNAKINISTYAFNGCTKLREVVLPDHLGSFNSAAFEGCTALKSITVNDTNPNYKSENGILYKKSSADSDDFAELLFYPTGLITENGGVISNLPDTLVAIGGSAFSNNGNLVKITLPAKIKSIGNSAFANCSALEEVVFLGVTDAENAATELSIGTSAFENCASLNKFVLPEYAKSFSSNAFKASGIVSFTVPAGVTSIGSAAFNNCANLKTMTFKNTSAISIASTLFKGCTALTEVDLGANISFIGTSAFEGCAALETVVIATENSKLTKIGNKAFYNCPSLETITIPKTVKAIGDQAFAATEDAPGRLSSISFELGGTDTLHIYQKTFQYQPELTSITFPARVSLYTGSTNTTIDDNGNKTAKPINSINFRGKTADNGIAAMFTGCSSLATITIAKEEGVNATVNYATLDGVLYTADMKFLIFCPAANVGEIKDGAPTYTITIPTTVTDVMSKAFLNLTKIKTITFAEFESTDTNNYGKQLLYIGHYSSVSKAYAVFGGESTSITEINLPSHIHTIRGYAFGVTGENVTATMKINFNMDASNITLSNSAFRSNVATTLALPSVTSFGTYMFADTMFLKSVTFTTTAKALPTYMFQNAKGLTSYTIPENFETIGTNAFENSALTSVTIHNKVTSIGNSAFLGCTSLSTVNMGTGVTSIGTEAFSNCASLTSISLPANLTTIDVRAFSGTGLTSIVIPSEVTTIKNQLFKNCKSLVSVTFQGDITSFAQELFFGCEKLTNVSVDSWTSITSVGSYAFCGCESFSDFDFTKLTAVTSIGNNAFSHTAIKKVDLSKTKISSANITNSFNNMPVLEEIVFAPNWTKAQTTIDPLHDYNGYLAYGGPLDNVPSLKKITLNAKFTTDMLAKTMNGSDLPYYLFDYVFANCTGIEIVVPGTIATSYKADEDGIFFSSDKKTLYWVPKHIALDSYEIPDTVETIGKYAFMGTNIKSIVIPRTVKTIKEGAFMYANSTSITVKDTAAEPSYMATIGDYAFAGSKITSFVIPDSVTDAGKYLFAYAYDLKSITTGKGMTEIKEGFAKDVTELEELIIQEGVITILGIFSDAWSAYSFDFETPIDYTHKLKSLTIPASVQEILGAFYGMNGLETVTFAEGSQLDDLDSLSFAFCTSLVSVNIPAGVTELGDGVFYGCSSLKTLDLSKLDLSQSQYFINGISEYTFAYTTSLESILLPAGIESIGNRAFYCSGILSIDIPASVTELGLGVFEDATRLKTVTFTNDSKITVLDGVDIPNMFFIEYPAITDANSNIFKGTTSLETVILPNSMTEIGAGIFENSGIMEIRMADPSAESKLEYIGDRAFAGCTRLAYFGFIENPDSEEDRVVYNYLEGVTEIGNEAFAGCTALTKVDFGRDLEVIGDKAFANCTALERAYIPASVIELGGNPYEGVDVNKLEIDPTNATFALETAADGTVYLRNTITGKVIGTWAPAEETLPENPEA